MRSKILFTASTLAAIYSLYLVFYFSGTTLNSDGVEAIGGAIASALIAPHMIMFLIGAIFGWVGFIFKKAWAALVAAILYSVGTVFFLMYAMYGVPIMILGFIGYAKQAKLNMQNSKKDNNDSAIQG